MFYRRKVILALLEALGGEVSKTDFQKHLFLFTQAQAEPAYDFVPYRFGCFSFSAEADRTPMVRTGLIKNNGSWAKKTGASYLGSLRPADQERLRAHVTQYGTLRGRELVRTVYLSHPYYAICSEIAADVLDKQQQKVVAAAVPRVDGPALLTIGYEGRSLEAYLNVLLENGVRLLCDVRANPVSRKFGFSKGQLSATTDCLGIGYVHIPELGIASGKRKALTSPDAYTRLFAEYEQNTLPARQAELMQVRKLVEEHGRVALTCFEACHTECHRSRIADAMERLPGWDYPVIHA